ncbi:oligosaccharide flippase family protein [Patescibacteria group bacterium]
MKSLEKWQIISFLSRALAMSFGIIQSFVILRILSVGEWGIIQLAVSVGAALGIYQHLGLASASNREIAAAERKNDIFKVFFTTVTVRYLVTIPLSFGLFYFAPRISNAYGFEDMLLPLRIYSFVILIQGVQAILNSVISGTKRFKELFIFQGVIALASVLIYIPFVYFYNVIGFFYALLIHEIIKSITLFVIALKPYIKSVRLPTKKEYITIFKELFTLGLSIYIVKILVINWEKAGANMLGFTQNAELVGIYSFALLYAKKLIHVSDAITDVNLPVFSEKYVTNIGEFKKLFSTNFNRVFSMIVFFAMSAVFWAPELIKILIGSNKYDSAIPLLMPMVFAFIFFSLINIIQSSVAIPAKLVKEMILGFFLLLLGTLGAFYGGRSFFDPISSMAYAMLLGAGLAFIYLVYLLQNKLKFKIVDHSHVLLLIQGAVIASMAGIENFIIKAIAYIVFLLLYVWGLYIASFVTKGDFLFVKRKLMRK